MFLSEEPRFVPRHGMHHRRHHHHHRVILTPHAGGDLNEFYDGQLGGFGKKLRKAVRKVGKVVAVGAALYFAPTLAVSALKAVQARKAAEANAKAQSEANQRAQAEAAAAIASMNSVAPAASGMVLGPSTAPPAGLVARSMNVPTMTSFNPSSDSGSPAYEPIESGGGMPKWVVPAALGGAGLVAILLLRKQ